MGNFLFYFAPVLRPIFTLSCWDPKRKTSKLRNDAIKQRLDNRCPRGSGGGGSSPSGIRSTHARARQHSAFVDLAEEHAHLPPPSLPYASSL